MSEKNKNFKTTSNINLKSYYGKNNPGEFPYTSGIYPEMYRAKLWTMRQYAGFSSARKSNERYRYLLSQGVSGLSIAFDLPTQTGYDSDHDLSIGEIGRVGVPICTIDDMRVLLKNIPLDKISISMTINSTAIILLSFLIVLAEENNISTHKLTGTIQNDILKEYIARGTYIFPPRQSMKLVTDIFEYCNLNMKKWNAISISGYHIREAGSTAVQELAFTFSNAIEYTNAAIQQGLDVNVFTSQMSFFFNSHNNFFEEIAKFRAARKVWANIMKDRFGVTNKKGLMCRFHTQTAGSTLQAQQIDNNVIRTTMQAASAILGGTQSLHTNSKDEALSLPTKESAQLALRTQQILAYETEIPNVVDPLAGSYFIEDLTNKIELKTLELIKEVDNKGGAISAIEDSFQQNEIANSSFDYQSDIESGKQTIVGVNKFKDTQPEKSDHLFSVDNSSAKNQLKRLEQFKKNRSLSSVQNSLNELIKSLNSNKNLIPKIVNCIKNSCTLGEICDVIKSKYGTY
jgi:methylmalonyl-CoA mutase N-terminal domain/subunit